MFLSVGAAISWQSKLIPNSNLSSCEIEYMTFSSAAIEASLRQLQQQMVGELATTLVKVCVDSQPAVDIVNNPV